MRGTRWTPSKSSKDKEAGATCVEGDELSLMCSYCHPDGKEISLFCVKCHGDSCEEEECKYDRPFTDMGHVIYIDAINSACIKLHLVVLLMLG